MKTISNYEQKAIDFLKSTNTEFKAEFLRNGKYFSDDKEERDIYKITLKRGQREYSFEFGQSIAESVYMNKNRGYMNKNMNKNRTTPTSYDVLTCLTKYDPGTLEDFCAEFGYDVDSKKAEKTYLAVKNEYLNLIRLFTDSEIEQLAKI